MRFTMMIFPAAAAAAVAAYGVSNPPASPEQRFLPGGKTHYFHAEEGSIAYDDTGGQGPAVILVPGMGDFRAQYRFLTPRLAAAGYRVITMDIRGQGESSVGWRECDAAAVGGDILALMSSLQVERADLVGNSFAAGSVYWAAVQAPERVRSLTLLGPAMRNGKSRPIMNLALKAGLAGFWGPRFWLAYWGGLFPVRKPADFADYRAALLSSLSEPGRMEALRKLVLASKTPVESILGAAKVPTLLIMGTKDKDFPDPAAEAHLLGSRTGARVEMLEAGHYPQVEASDQTAGLMIPFLGAR